MEERYIDLGRGGAIPPMIASPATMPDGTKLPIADDYTAVPAQSAMPGSASSPMRLPKIPPEVRTATVQDTQREACTYKSGELPRCAPLAAGFVPFQQNTSPKYEARDALTHGTLFPALDLPFMNIANKNNPYAETPLGELMALDFAIHELTLYLDTHKEDRDAFDMQKTLLALAREGRREYTRRYGPVSTADLEDANSYTWLTGPWPWEYNDGRSVR